ncbi:Hypothetical protein FKW44_010504 [Caligus rogercresseyi]|uniref:Uncharacterized protein n=1 Tax=Caligus rogercresseyi TaxID=217165 RepID=A0A7T8K927_CALRO|nr:Hypothetical protein FKW44_010504 [Caligus rogercresseyi]
METPDFASYFLIRLNLSKAVKLPNSLSVMSSAPWTQEIGRAISGDCNKGD